MFVKAPILFEVEDLASRGPRRLNDLSWRPTLTVFGFFSPPAEGLGFRVSGF